MNSRDIVHANAHTNFVCITCWRRAHVLQTDFWCSRCHRDAQTISAFREFGRCMIALGSTGLFHLRHYIDILPRRTESRTCMCSTHKFTAKFSPWSKFPRRIRFACVSKSITTSDLCAHIEWIFSFLQSIQFCMWRQISSRAMYQRLHAVNIKIDAQTIGLCDFVVSHMLRATRTKKEREKHVTANYDNKLQNLTPDQWTCPMLNCSSYIFDWLTFCATPNFPHSISSFNDFPFRMGAFFVTAVHSFASNMANQHVLNCRLRREKKTFISNLFLITFAAIKLNRPIYNNCSNP